MSEKTQKSTLKNKIFAIVLSLLLLILILAVLFFWRESQIRYQDLSSQASSAEIALKDIKQTVSQLKNDQLAQEETLNQQKQRLLALHQFIGQEAQSSQLMRIEYLIQSAHDQSLLMHNPQASIALLKASDEAIKEANLPAWVPLANAVTKDLETLTTLPRVDFKETLSQFNELDPLLNQLPLREYQSGVHQEKAISPLEQKNSINTLASPHEWKWWQIRLNTLWTDLKKIVVIRHNTELVMPLLNPEQQVYLRENLHLLLFQAKWALFHQEDDLYHSSLKQLAQWINTYFNTENQSTKTVLANLETLQKIDLPTTFPSLEESLMALEEIKKDNHPVVLPEHMTFEKSDVESLPQNKPIQNPSSIAPMTPSEIPETPEVTDS